LRTTSRLTVDAARRNPLAISRIDKPEAMPREMFFPFGERECSLRAVTKSRSYPAVLRQQKMNRAMILDKSTTNLM